MSWNLDFISEEDFKNHVRATIMKYGEKLESYDSGREISPTIMILDIFTKTFSHILRAVKFHKQDGMLFTEIRMEYKCQKEMLYIHCILR